MPGILIAVLFLSPYILVPFFMARMFRTDVIKSQWLPYLLTAIFLLIYPDLTFWVLSLFREPLKEGEYMCMVPPIFINIPLFPIAISLQVFFSLRPSNKAKTKMG
jgi:hypothetical protein